MSNQTKEIKMKFKLQHNLSFFKQQKVILIFLFNNIIFTLLRMCMNYSILKTY